MDIPHTATHIAPSDEPLILEPLTESGARSIGLGEIMRVAFDSLLANKVRAILTMLGVIIGVASVVALISIGQGASNSITGQVSSLGTNVLTIMAGSPGRGGPGQGGVQAQNLTMADSAAIAALKLPIIGPAPQVSTSTQIIAPVTDKTADVVGVEANYKPINNLTMTSGVFFSDNQVTSGDAVVVIGNTLATDLFGTGQAVGQTLRIKGQVFRVVGVLASKGSGGFGSVDDRALIPISRAQVLFGQRALNGSYRVSNIAVSVINSSDVDYVERRIQETLRQTHNLKSDGSADDFNVLNQASLLSSLSTITTALTAFLAAIAGISLLVGGIGIMNIMLVSVTERTREIGLRKAVGARGRDIMMQFVVEAVALSVTGGLIGLALGSVAPLAVTALGLLDAPVTATAAALAVGFSLAVGLFFGIYPARRAARLNPIEALRHE